MLEKFRKYQAALLVLFGVFLMFSFVIAPPLNDYLAQQAMIQTGNYQPVVTWTDSSGNAVSLNEVDLQTEYETHVLTVQFLQRLLEAAHARNRPQTQAEQQRAQGRMFKLESAIQFNPETGQFERTDLRGSQLVTFEIPTVVTSEAELVRKLMFAQEAEQTGIQVSDETVTNYLGNIVNLTVAADQVDVIRKQTSEQLSRARLYEQLRKELLAQHYRKLTIDPVEWVNALPTPGQERGYFDRVNRQIKVAVVPFPVADYMAQTKQPDATAIEKHFNTHKDRIKDPLDDEPGFKERRKISWAYVAADLAPFIAAELPAAREAITAQEIEERYENAKSGQLTSYAWHPPYIAPQDHEAAGEQPPEPLSSETSSTNTPTADAPAATTPDATTPPADETPQDSPSPAKPAETPSSEDATPAPEKKAEQEQDDQKQASGGTAGRTPTRFVAVSDGQEPSPEAGQDAAPPAAETPAQDPAEPDSEKQAPAEPAAPENATSTEAPPVTEGAAAVPETPVPPLDAKPEAQPATSTETKLTRVLDGDLREQIRGELAETKAREQARQLLTEKLDAILPKIRAYQRNRNRWRVHIGRLVKQATDQEETENSRTAEAENAKSDRMLTEELQVAWDTLLAKLNPSGTTIPVGELSKENLGALERWAKVDGDPESLSRSDLNQPAPPEPATLATNAHAFLRGEKLDLLNNLEFADKDLNDLTRRFEDLIGPMQQMNAQVQQAQQILTQAIAENGEDSSEALFARNQLQQMQFQSQNFQQQLFSLMQQPFSQFAYAQELLPFETVRLQKNTPAGEPVEYLVWKTDEQAERAPDLDEEGVKEKVEESLRRDQARTLAEEAATKLQTEIADSGDQSLVIDYLVPQATDTDPSQNVTPAETHPSLAALCDRAEVTTNFFSWLQSTPSFGMPGNTSPSPTISTLMVVKPATPTSPENPEPENPEPETDAKGDCVTQPPASEQPEKPATDTETADQQTAEQAGTAGEEAATEEEGNPTPTTNEAAAIETVAEQAVEATAPALPRTLAEIGSKFMQSVFSMNPGELNIAWNEPKTVCYLVQITAQQQPNTELHKQFVEKRLNLQQTDAQQIAQIHR
ncbi:MAG: hypothetical protein VX346_21160, partial [Planctomycetota bacterium]|nr:hypothetical protein [Planctomycetota bacterium]